MKTHTNDVSITASNLTEPVDLTTTLALRVNGVVQYVRSFQLTASPPTHADCTGRNCGSDPCSARRHRPSASKGPSLSRRAGRHH